MSCVGYKLKVRSPIPQKDGHNQRTAGKTKPQWNGHARNRDGQKAQQDAQYDTQKNRNDVGVIKLLHLVAQTIGQAFDRALRSNTINLIAHLQMQVLVREERHACTKDSRDVDAVIAAQMQFSKAHPVDLILGNQNVAGNQRRMRRRKINVGFLLPKESNDRGLRLGSRHYSQLVTHKYLRVRTRTRDHAVVQNS